MKCQQTTNLVIKHEDKQKYIAYQSFIMYFSMPTCVQIWWLYKPSNIFKITGAKQKKNYFQNHQSIIIWQQSFLQHIKTILPSIFSRLAGFMVRSQKKSANEFSHCISVFPLQVKTTTKKQRISIKKKMGETIHSFHIVLYTFQAA